MPNAIKYSLYTQTQSLKIGNYWIGVGDVGKGPTVVTDYWNGITPPPDGYTIYGIKGSNGPFIYLLNDDDDLVSITNKVSGQSFTTVTQSLAWYSSQNNILAVNKDYVSITTDKLSICLDPSFIPSYPKTGTTFYNVGNNNNPLTFSLLNNVSYSSEGGGSLLFDGVDDEVVSDTFYTMSQDMTWDIWVKRTSNGNIFNMMMSNIVPYMAFRGSVGDPFAQNKYQVAWYSKFGVTQSQRNLYTTGTYSNNTWYNFTFTLSYDLQNQISTGKIYVNGVLNNTASYDCDTIYQPSGSSRLRIGNYSSNQYPFPGYIGRFLVYDRVLSDSEILDNYDKSKMPYIVSAFQNSIQSYGGVYEAQGSQINILQNLNSI